MKILIVVSVLAGVLAGPGTVSAQDTALPPPQSSGETAVTQLEKDILSGFFTALNEARKSQDETATVGDIVSDVLKTVVKDQTRTQGEGSDDAAAENDDDDDDDDGDGNGNGQGKKKKKKKNKKKKKSDNASNGNGNGKKKTGLPPGLQKQLAKNGTLPPGLQKKLEASGVLPPGLQARALPAELEAQLPALPAGQKRVVVDNDVLIVDEVIGVVLDSIPDIIPSELVPVLAQLPGLMTQ